MSGMIPIGLEPVECSPYIRVNSATFRTNSGRTFRSDILRVHDSVAVLLYHEERDSFVLVKQFRPAVYLNRVSPPSFTPDGNSATPSTNLDMATLPNASSSLGYTLELCDGIVDKPDMGLVQIAKREILEECGFDVQCEKIERITSYRSVETGALQTLFYANVNDNMKISDGGGNPNEGEKIEVVYIPVANAKEILVQDESAQRTTDLMFCVLWFLENKCCRMKNKKNDL